MFIIKKVYYLDTLLNNIIKYLFITQLKYSKCDYIQLLNILKIDYIKKSNNYGKLRNIL